MSFDLAKQVWGIKLPPGEREVLRVLCEHADEFNISYPGVERIAWHVDSSPRTVQRILAKLTVSGIIIPVAKTFGGRGNTVVYLIDLTKGVQKGECPKKSKKYDNLSEFAADNGKEISNNRNRPTDTLPAPSSVSFNQNSNDAENHAILTALSDANSVNLSPIPAQRVTNWTFEDNEKMERVTNSIEKGDKSGFALIGIESCKNHTQNMRARETSDWLATVPFSSVDDSEGKLPDFNPAEIFADSRGTRFVLKACGWWETYEIQKYADQQEAMRIGKVLDRMPEKLTTVNPKRFRDYWHNAMNRDAQITPNVVSKHLEAYLQWEAKEAA